MRSAVAVPPGVLHRAWLPRRRRRRRSTADDAATVAPPPPGGRTPIPLRFRGIGLVSICVTLFVALLPRVDALRALYPDGTSVYCAAVTSSYFLGPQQFNFTARAIWAQPSNGCDLSSSSDLYRDKIVITSLGSCSPETRVRAAQSVGAAGVLTFNNKLSDTQIGEEVYVFDGTDRSKLVLPTLLLSKECESVVYSRVFDNPPIADSELLPNERIVWEFAPGPQIWIQHYDSAIWFAFMKVIIPIWSGANFLVALWKLYGFRRSQNGFRCNSLSQWTLILTALSNSERCWYSPLFFLANPKPVFPNIAGNILLSISAPTELSATLLAMFFWAHASDLGRGRTTSPLDRYKKAIAVGTVVLFLTDIGSAISQGLYQNISVIAAALRGGIYLLFSILLGGGFLFFGFKQLSALARYATRTQEQHRIAHIARWMALSGFFRLLSLGTVSLAVVPGFIWSFNGLCSFIFGSYLALNAISSCQLTMLEVPRAALADTSASNSQDGVTGIGHQSTRLSRGGTGTRGGGGDGTGSFMIKVNGRSNNGASRAGGASGGVPSSPRSGRVASSPRSGSSRPPPLSIASANTTSGGAPLSPHSGAVAVASGSGGPLVQLSDPNQNEMVTLKPLSLSPHALAAAGSGGGMIFNLSPKAAAAAGAALGLGLMTPRRSAATTTLIANDRHSPQSVSGSHPESAAFATRPPTVASGAEPDSVNSKSDGAPVTTQVFSGGDVRSHSPGATGGSGSGAGADNNSVSEAMRHRGSSGDRVKPLLLSTGAAGSGAGADTRSNSGKRQSPIHYSTAALAGSAIGTGTITGLNSATPTPSRSGLPTHTRVSSRELSSSPTPHMLAGTQSFGRSSGRARLSPLDNQPIIPPLAMMSGTAVPHLSPFPLAVPFGSASGGGSGGGSGGASAAASPRSGGAPTSARMIEVLPLPGAHEESDHDTAVAVAIAAAAAAAAAAATEVAADSDAAAPAPALDTAIADGKAAAAAPVDADLIVPTPKAGTVSTLSSS